MNAKLGILVTSERHLDHLIGICRAATDAGKEVTVFLTNQGVLFTQDPRFVQLEGQATSACATSISSISSYRSRCPWWRTRTSPPKCAMPKMIEDCDRYLVL